MLYIAECEINSFLGAIISDLKFKCAYYFIFDTIYFFKSKLKTYLYIYISTDLKKIYINATNNMLSTVINHPNVQTANQSYRSYK